MNMRTLCFVLNLTTLSLQSYRFATSHTPHWTYMYMLTLNIHTVQYMLTLNIHTVQYMLTLNIHTVQYMLTLNIHTVQYMLTLNIHTVQYMLTLNIHTVQYMLTLNIHTVQYMLTLNIHTVQCIYVRITINIGSFNFGEPPKLKLPIFKSVKNCQIFSLSIFPAIQYALYVHKDLYNAVTSLIRPSSAVPS